MITLDELNHLSHLLTNLTKIDQLVVSNQPASSVYINPVTNQECWSGLVTRKYFLLKYSMLFEVEQQPIFYEDDTLLVELVVSCTNKAIVYQPSTFQEQSTTISINHLNN